MYRHLIPKSKLKYEKRNFIIFSGFLQNHVTESTRIAVFVKVADSAETNRQFKVF